MAPPAQAQLKPECCVWKAKAEPTTDTAVAAREERQSGLDATSPASVRAMEFSRELRNDVLAGDITLTVRLWKRPQVKGGPPPDRPWPDRGRCRRACPVSAITEEDVRRAGEPDRETLRKRAAHAGPIDDHTVVYRIELHAVSSED